MIPSTWVIVFILAALVAWIFWPFFIGTGWLPSPMRIVRKMLDMADVRPVDIVYDLGCGDGRIIITAAQEFGARAVGVEADPIRTLLSKLRTRVAGLEGKVNILWGNFFHLNLGEATVVTIYQSQGTNNNLREKFKRELKPGTRIVSYMFTFDGWKPEKVDEKSNVYLYVI